MSKIIIIILTVRISTFKIKNVYHLDKETYTVFGLPIQNKNVNFLVWIFWIKRGRIRRKINSQGKVFICDAMRDLVSVTIWHLYDVMIVQTHANACYAFFYLLVISICLNELAWRSNRSIYFQTLEFQSRRLGASTRRKSDNVWMLFPDFKVSWELQCNVILRCNKLCIFTSKKTCICSAAQYFH